MIAARHIHLVLVTTPDHKTARMLARHILQARLAACVNLLAGVESHYWWRSKLESSKEVLLLIKTTKTRLPALEKLILQKHPYDTPEIIALSLASSTRRYLRWLRESVD